MKKSALAAGAVVLYVRVSTEEQAREGVSLAAQEEKLRTWWALHGEGRPVVVEGDEGVSGCRMSRPGLERALAACQRGGVLVVYSLSRLARSTRGTLEIAERLERAGCDLVSLSERIDTTTATGKMVFRLLAVLAEFERDLISERVRASMSHLASQGRRVSRFDRSSDAAAGRALELQREGLSLREIGRRLEAEGVATVTGAKWCAKVVRSMVHRELEREKAVAE